jgi:acyl carrier protein
MIINEISEIIEQILKDNGESLSSAITEHTTFQDIGLNSFDLATLTVEIEDKFDVDIFENSIIINVGEIIKLIEEKSK